MLIIFTHVFAQDNFTPCELHKGLKDSPISALHYIHVTIRVGKGGLKSPNFKSEGQSPPDLHSRLCT